METIFDIKGISCPHCMLNAKEAFEAVAGVKFVNINFEVKAASVEHEDILSPASLKSEMEKAGYKIKIVGNKKPTPKRIALVVIAVAVLAGIGVFVHVSSLHSLVPVIDAPIWDDIDRDRIVMRINQEGVNQRRAIIQVLTDQIEALDDVDKANVTIVIPSDGFSEVEQNPITASVIITKKPGSDIYENPRKIEGIQKLLKYAIEGLSDENIVIVGHTGLILNDI